MIGEPDEKTGANGMWTFDCNKCNRTKNFDTEAEALNEAKSHHEHDFRGHFNFVIEGPDGEITHGSRD